MNEEMPWVNLTQEEVDTLRKSKKELTEYAKEKLRKMNEEAAKREAANELYQDALHELDYIAAGGQDMEEFMNSYLVIQTALKVALGEEDV
jgi:hypothetical protein